LTKETNGSDAVQFWLLYLPRWLVGLFAASMLLWLGASFWADRLHDLLRLRSGVEQMTKRKQASASP
jgi:hypothetical protein